MQYLQTSNFDEIHYVIKHQEEIINDTEIEQQYIFYNLYNSPDYVKYSVYNIYIYIHNRSMNLIQKDYYQLY